MHFWISAGFIFLFTVTTIMANPVSLEDQWNDFKLKHEKSYSDEEEVQRFAIFKENVKKIEEHNKKYDAGEVTSKMGITKFSDLTHEEFKKFIGHGGKGSSQGNRPTAT